MFYFFDNYRFKIIFDRKSRKKNKIINYNSRNRINKIGLILDDQFNLSEDFFNELADKLSVSRKKIKILIFNKQNNSNNSSDYLFNSDEFTFFGKLNGDLETFSNESFDLLINYFNSNNNNRVNLLSLNSKKKFSVGFLNADSKINDIIFSFSPNESNLFIEELAKYTKKI